MTTIISNKTQLIAATLLAITGFSAQASDFPPPPPQEICADFPNECPSVQSVPNTTSSAKAAKQQTAQSATEQAQ